MAPGYAPGAYTVSTRIQLRSRGMVRRYARAMLRSLVGWCDRAMVTVQRIWRLGGCAGHRVIRQDSARRRISGADHLLACALRADQPHPGEVPLAHLQQSLESRRERGLRIFDDFAVDAHRAFLQFASRFRIARRDARGRQQRTDADAFGGNRCPATLATMMSSHRMAVAPIVAIIGAGAVWSVRKRMHRCCGR